MHFGPREREQFRVLVRAAPLDDRAATDEAHQLARAWLSRFSRADDSADIAACLEHKTVGYNGGLLEHVRRCRRALAAADMWINEHGPNLTLDAPGLMLGEYFLTQRITSRGGRVHTTTPMTDLIAELCTTTPCQATSPGYAPVEIDLSQAREHNRALPRAQVWFIATMNNYLNPMIRVMELMVAKGQRVALLAPQEASAWPNWKRVPAAVERVWFESALPSQAASHLQAELAAPTTPSLDGLTIDGVNLAPLLARDFTHISSVMVPHTRAYAAIGRRLVEDGGAEVVVCARLRRASDLGVVLGAQKAGARSLMLIHGHVTSCPLRRCGDGDFSSPDAMCVWGPAQRDIILRKEEGVDPHRLIATGNPDWDGLAARCTDNDRTRARNSVITALTLPDHRALITYTSQADSRPQFASVARAALASPSTILIVKVHPREDAGWYMNQVDAAHRSRVRIVGDGPTALHDLLLASDTMITLHSTTNIESLLLGTPVVTAAFGDLTTVDRLLPLETYGLPLATDEVSLRNLIQTIVADPTSYRTSLKPAMFRARTQTATGDSGATLRVCRLIDSLCAQGTSTPAEAA